MLLNESRRSSSISQSNQNETASQSGSAVGVTSANAAGSTSTGTPLRSRNQNRDRQQSDEKWDKQEGANIKGKNPPKPPEEFYKDLQQFHEKRGTTIMSTPKITGREVDLHRLYCEVTERGGFQKVNMRDEWDEVLPELGLTQKIVNGSQALKYIYRRILEKYERLNYFGEDPDKVDAMEASDMTEFNMAGGGRGRGSRYPSTYGSSNSAIIHNVAMSYNYRQHQVSMDRRRQFKLSTDLHKPSPYEKLMLSLLSPLPNEQDFAINACTLMANESKHTMKLNEYPKILDALLAHTGVFSDYTMRKLFQHVYSGVRHHSLYGFWYDLLNDKPQILDLYTDEQALRDAALIDDYDDGKPEMEGIWEDCKELDFLNLRTGLGTQDYVGQRVLQVISILRNLSFLEENLTILVKNKTFLRFLVMSSNIRWGNVHILALEIAGNIAGELEILDPSLDDLSRCLMATLCDGIEGPDRGVIINCLEILYKLCQKDTNEEFVLKCLNLNFYNTISLFLSLNDIMLLLFTLEAIYALTCLGPKSCSSMMQVKGIVDQLISLITVEAQSYGPDGCILMRVVETVPGNMLPMVAQNIANLQNVGIIPKPVAPTAQQQVVTQIKPQIIAPTATEVNEAAGESSQLQMPQNFTQEDEAYALAWLGATFERTPNVESYIETQELYRMYLSHCQKSGKHSVVNHLHFPKIIRLIFTNAVGPAVVRKADGVELPGLHYVSIRLRAQPLPLQQKSNITVGGQTPSPGGKQADTPGSGRKTKKKLKAQAEATAAANVTAAPPAAAAATANVASDNNPVAKEAIKSESVVTATVPPAAPSAPPATVAAEVIEKPLTPQPVDTKCEEKMDIEEELDETNKPEPIQTKSAASVTEAPIPVAEPPITQSPPVSTVAAGGGGGGAAVPASSSMIKSLLANKVNQRQQKQNINTSSTNPTTNPSASTDVATTAAPKPVATQHIKVAVAAPAITALVNNQILQHTPLKVGQTTIKPLNTQATLDKKLIPQISESTPPPLAPLSGANVAKDASGRPIILANQMLVDILDKKMVDPPIPGIIQKRKIEEQLVSAKRLAVDSSSSSNTSCSSSSIPKEEPQVTPSKNAANLYAEMAASILEDEDLEEFSTQPTMEQPNHQQTSLIIPAKTLQQSSAPPLPNVQRQLVFQTNQPQQMKLTQTSSGGNHSNQQIPNAVATIKTDQGLQTVPVILQQKPMEPMQHHHQQQQQIIQQIMQPAAQQQQQQTQYVLATNQHGQTYLVAQQTPSGQAPPPQQQQQQQPTQTVLVTQTPQQQSTGQKTIIILQQQAMPGQQQQIITTGPPGQGQKMIMTTAQGQQVLVTQRPQTPQQQIFINPQTGQATHIQHIQPVQQQQQRQIIQTTTTHQQQQQQQQTQQIQTGQMSPSLLNQLNQIPATIKLHQPIPQHQQPTATQQATITRVGQKMAIVQEALPPTQSTPITPVAIPQLQQHQSIIQQHIISGPAEKRHVILGGGRAIEIKETVITQAQPPPQQCQLNSQTIITQQPSVATTASCSSSSTPPLLQQQQVQQQIRAVIEQQQHPSIIQQKISSIPSSSSTAVQPQQQQQQQQSQVMVQQTTPVASVAPAAPPPTTTQNTPQPQQQQTPTLIAAKLPDPIPSLIQPKTQNVVQSIVPAAATNPQTLVNPKKPPPPSLIKPSLPTVKLPTIGNSGPPPLAAVNPNISATQQSAQSQTQGDLMNSGANNKKEEVPKITTTSSGAGAALQNPTQSTNSTANTTTSSSTQSAAQTSTSNTTSSTTSSTSTATANAANVNTTPQTQQQTGQAPTPPPPQQQMQPQTVVAPPQPQLSPQEAQWLYICDWRNCPRKKFKSITDLQHHVCSSHAPDHLDSTAEIFCQWGVGPGLCDGIPRKRFSLMTHLIDRHVTTDSLRSAVQRRIATGMHNIAPAKPPVTIVRNIELAQRANNASPAPSTSSSSSSQTATMGSSALQAIKRHTADFLNSKELMDENEGPVTKSIRLTASLILRNLVTYTTTAKRSIRRFEPHLSNIALSNVESSGTISHILYELNN